jgi:DeoR/GlpR family transcriptional regulator of sugar metabolism
MIEINHIFWHCLCMRVSRNVVEARREVLAGWLQNGRYLPLGDICRKLSVSEATARRDLTELEEAGRVRRTPGGALTDDSARFPTFSERLEDETVEKQDLARQVLPHLLSGFTIYVDGGTSPFFLARVLPEASIAKLQVVTNSLPVVEYLAGTGVSLHVPGGDLVPRQSLLVGERAEHALRRWRFDAAIFGAEAVNRRGIWNSTPAVVSLQKAAMERAKASFFLVTSSKLGKETKTFLCGWSQPIRLITDKSPQFVAKHGIPVETLEAL